MSELMNIKSINEYNKKGFVKQFGYNLRQSWYFETWYDKLILVVLSGLGMWKIISFF